MLRKLTFKSTMKFGKFSDFTVQQIIDMNRRCYLLWAYYCNSDIDFFPDVLDAIYVKEEHRIKKPGKITDEEFKKLMRSRTLSHIMKSDDRVAAGGRLKKCYIARQKSKNKSSRARDNIKYSKASLTWKNQGH